MTQLKQFNTVVKNLIDYQLKEDKDMDIEYGNLNEEVNKEQDVQMNASTSGNAIPPVKDDVIDPAKFKMPEQAEKTLDSYISKLEDYYSKIGEERNDVIAQRAKVLQAVLETDMLHTK